MPRGIKTVNLCLSSLQNKQQQHIVVVAATVIPPLFRSGTRRDDSLLIVHVTKCIKHINDAWSCCRDAYIYESPGSQVPGAAGMMMGNVWLYGTLRRKKEKCHWSINCRCLWPVLILYFEMIVITRLLFKWRCSLMIIVFRYLWHETGGLEEHIERERER